MPVIPALWEAEVGVYGLSSGVRDLPGQHSETPFLQNLRKLVGATSGAEEGDTV